MLVMPAAAGEGPGNALSAPAEVEQGQVFVVTLRPSGPLREAQVDFLGRRFKTWTEPGPAIRALVAVEADDPPGLYHLIFSGVDEAGGRLAASHEVKVRGGDFGEQRLSLPPEMVTPDAATLELINTQKERLTGRLANASPERLWTGGFAPPVPGDLLSRYGVLRVLNDEPRSRHGGIDLRAAEGEPVRAAASGRVLLTDSFYFEGNLVVLDHGLGLATIYCHLSEIGVKEGDLVTQGQVLGKAGHSGRATGPHLHFGARLNDVRLDPLWLFKLSGEAPRSEAK
jgi:murein DD-endopeptidase MepM/ murein hydrolase activator NlpD